MNRKSSFKRFRATNACIAALTVAAFGGRAFDARASAPDWLRAAARTALPAYAPDTSAVVLLSEHATTVNGAGEIKSVIRQACKILRPEGRDFGTVVVHFDSETQLTSLKAWSLPAKGGEYELKEKDAVETSLFAGEVYGDARFKLLKIPAAEPGSVVGYEYEQKRRSAVLQDIWRFQERVPVRRAQFSLELPSGWEFKPDWSNYASRPPRPLGDRRWIWELDDVPALETESLMPAWHTVAGRLAVGYYPRGSEPDRRGHSSWRDVGVWYAELAARRRESTPEIRKKVADLTSSAPSALEKVRNLASFVQRDIRYVAIEIGIGGYQPHFAREVLANGYGDCKDKVTLLSTMLKDAGVESQYVLTHSERGMVISTFPSALSFNHVILAIRLSEADTPKNLYSARDYGKLGFLLLFDPTDPYTPLGYLPPALQANQGLLVADQGGDLITLPLLSASTNRLIRAGKLTLTNSEALTGAVREIRWGAAASTLRARLLDVPVADRKKVLESFLSGFLGSFRLGDIQVEQLNDPGGSLILDYGFIAENYAQSSDNLVLFRPRVLGRKGTDLDVKGRKHPIEFPYTSSESDDFEITFPRGFVIDELPASVQAECSVAQYRSGLEAAENTVRYRRTYEVKGVRVPASESGELKKFFQRIAEDERAIIVLKRTAP